jgi:hypothetical protein
MAVWERMRQRRVSEREKERERGKERRERVRMNGGWIRRGMKR